MDSGLKPLGTFTKMIQLLTEYQGIHNTQRASQEVCLFENLCGVKSGVAQT